MIDSALAHKGKYYGVRIGRQQGVYETWAEAHAQVVGFPGAAYQGFPTFHEAHAFVVAGGARREELLLRWFTCLGPSG